MGTRDQAQTFRASHYGKLLESLLEGIAGRGTGDVDTHRCHECRYQCPSSRFFCKCSFILSLIQWHTYPFTKPDLKTIIKVLSANSCVVPTASCPMSAFFLVNKRNFEEAWDHWLKALLKQQGFDVCDMHNLNLII